MYFFYSVNGFWGALMSMVPNYIFEIIEEGEKSFKEFKYTEALEFFKDALIKLDVNNCEKEKGYVYWQIGKVHQKTGDYEKSISNLKNALKRAKNIPVWIDVARIYTDIGLTYNKMGYVNSASENFNAALSLFEKYGNKKDMCSIYVNFSSVLIYKSEYVEAEKKLLHSQKLLVEIDDLNLEGVIFNNFGHLYDKWGKYIQAIKYYNKALNLLKKVDNKIEVAQTLNNIASINSQLGEMKKARTNYDLALEISRKIGDKGLVAIIISNLGSLFQDLGDYKKAQEYFSEVEMILKEVTNLRLKFGIFHAIGDLNQKQGNYKRAKSFFKKSLELSRKGGFRNSEASCYNNLGGIYYHWGNFGKAIEYYDKAQEIQYALKNVREIGATLNNLALANYHLGKIDQSLQKYQESLSLFEETGDKLGIATNLDNIGHVFYLMTDYNEALDYHERALKIFTEIGNREGQGRVYNNLGIVFQKTKQYTDAMEYFNKSMEISNLLKDRKGIASTLDNIASLFKQQNKFNEAYEMLIASLKIRKEIQDLLGISTVLNNIGHFLSLTKKFSVALKYYRKSLKLSKKIGNKTVEATTLFNMADIYTVKRNYSKALKQLKESFKIKDFLDSLAPLSIMRTEMRENSSIQILNKIISCCIKLNKIDEALAYSEYIKGREMINYGEIHKGSINEDFKNHIEILNQVKEQIQQILSKIPKIQSYYEDGIISKKRLDSKIEILSKKIENLNKQRKVLQDELRIKFPSKGIIFPSDPLLIIKDFKELLIKDWMILEYHHNILTNKMYIFIIEKEQNIKIIEYKINEENFIAIKKNLVRVLNDYQNIQTNISDRLISKNIQRNQENVQKEFKWYNNALEEGFRKIAKDSSEVFFPTELTEYLDSKEISFLTIVPSGYMHNFPLETILVRNEYLGLKYNFSRAFNLQTLISSLKTKERKATRALVVGNPTEGITSSLLDAKKEAEYIIDILERNKLKVDPLIGKKANLSDFIELLRKNKYQIIHFAGHARFNGDNPELSSLIFRESGEIKNLYGNMIPLDINLDNNPLLILSACETGLVVTKVGDEVYGLTRGIVEAGCTNTILTGWKILDDSTREFFQVFYNMLFGQKPISEALRDARYFIYEKYTHERNKNNHSIIRWGAFRHYGKPF